ncbi:M10 family metallopeptidase C-terminal domain-containing protein [Microbulbifer sp. S227A]|uniref:M10 family metallopeptidase C-terminal domain-containing protein n=1 Tax=Microbulbifer sp. S227A TaxID=3415131 RepID=UPI003C7CDD1A
MSGVREQVTSVIASGDPRIDAILHNQRWLDGAITYSAPADLGAYEPGYGGGENQGFLPASPLMRAALTRLLDADSGNRVHAGFAVEGFTALDVTPGRERDASVRLAQTAADPYDFGTAWAYFPGTFTTSGDIWTHNGRLDYTGPLPGNYAHHTLVHELGHTLGLVHGHEGTAFGTLPADYDSMEYTVMTYRSHVGAASGQYTNETNGYAQGFMMLDIAALQYLYGANFEVNSDDTVYSWYPYKGATLVDGTIAFTAAGNRIFATIWDGGGQDTYDLSAYSTPVVIDLAPGGHSVFDTAQLARLGEDTLARGNIFNALQYQDDPRSLIENAIGGDGADEITGNAADNRLEGRAQDDRLDGAAGADLALGQLGNDMLYGGGGADRLIGGHGNDWLSGGSDGDVLLGGAGDDRLFGRKGDDELKGGMGDDIIDGGKGRDRLSGNDGDDHFLFRTAEDSGPGPDADLIRDFEQGQDLIDLSQLGAMLSFMGNGALLAGSASLAYQHDGALTRVLLDLDGDLAAEMQIDMTGLIDLTEADFIL